MSRNGKINVLYGILTNGDSTIRHTTENLSTAPADVKRLVQALLPSSLSTEARRALAEMYVRLCWTDSTLIRKIKIFDPLNTYELHSFYANFSDNVDLTGIVQNIKKLGLTDEENSFLPLDYIVNALNKLVDRLV